MRPDLSRRGWLACFGRLFIAPPKPGGTGGESAHPAPPAPALPAADRVAVIQGRFCLARTSFCSVCQERCPVPGAMRLNGRIPMVVADACTGCGVCREVCPAPTNAVLVMPRRRPLPPSTP